MPAAFPGCCRGSHAALPREFTGTIRSGARTNRCCSPPEKKKKIKNPRGTARLWLEPQRRQMKVLGKERRRRGRFNLYCSSSHGNQLSCAQFQLFLTLLKERRGLFRAEPSREGPQSRGTAPGAGAVAQGRRGRGNRAGKGWQGWALSSVPPAEPWRFSVMVPQ